MTFSNKNESSCLVPGIGQSPLLGMRSSLTREITFPLSGKTLFPDKGIATSQILSNLIRTLAIATAFRRFTADPDLRAHATGSFQDMT